MSYTETMIIPQDARTTLVRHRDFIKHKYGVVIFFPKNAVRGNNQEITIQGTPTAIFNAKPNIHRVLCDWRVEFDAFRERVARKKALRNRFNVQLPSVKTQKVKTISHKATTGMFAGLDEDVPDTYAVEQHEHNKNFPMLVTKNVTKNVNKNEGLMEWNIVAGKAAQEQEVDISSMSWGDLV